MVGVGAAGGKARVFDGGERAADGDLDVAGHDLGGLAVALGNKVLHIVSRGQFATRCGAKAARVEGTNRRERGTTFAERQPERFDPKAVGRDGTKAGDDDASA